MWALNLLGVSALAGLLAFMFCRGTLLMSAAFVNGAMWLLSIVTYVTFFGLSNAAILCAVCIILTMCTAFSLALYPQADRGRIMTRKTLEYMLVGPRSIVFTGILAGSAVFGVLLKESGVIDGGASGILRSARYFSAIRYEEGIGIPVSVRVLNVLLYFGMAVGLMVYWERLLLYGRNSLWLWSPAVMLLGESILIGTKSIAVLCVAFALSSYFSVAAYYQTSIRRGRAALWIIAALAALFAFVVFVHHTRTGGTMPVLSIIEKLLTSYLWIPFVAFFDWAQQADSISLLPRSAGAELFAGISAHLFPDFVKAGEMVTIEVASTLYTTNVYTLLRTILSDFGAIGATAFLGVTGWVLGRITAFVRSGIFFALAPMVVMSNFVLFSFTGSLFKFLTNILAAGLLLAYFAGSELWRNQFLRDQRPGTDRLHDLSFGSIK